MTKAKTLETKARDYIIEQMRDLGEMTTEKVMDLIRPHYLFDPLTSKEQGIRRKANQLMCSMRDENGVRTCYNATIDNQSVYVNVEKSIDINALSSVIAQLEHKYAGLNEGLKKVRARKQEVSGQITFEELEVVRGNTKIN